MDKPVEVAHYIRRGRPEKAIIYVRGENESSQEMKCRMYASDKGYEVVCVIRHIEDVKQCDVLIMANFSRISRKQMEIIKTYKMFKARGIRIESIADKDADGQFSAKDIYKAFETFEKEYNEK